VRVGELDWLRWANVDLTGRRVRIVDFATVVGFKLVASPGKSDSAVRTIDLDDGLVGVLRRRREAQRFESRAAGIETPPFVFTTPEGAPYHPQTVSKLLAERSVAAGLPRLTAHGLRHTSATLMLDQGVPPKVAAERLGHSDPGLFIRLYSHVTPTMQRAAADAIGGALFGAALETDVG
jgi:integrase